MLLIVYILVMLIPDAFDRSKLYPVLYVLPVEVGIGGRYGDGLQAMRYSKAHNRFQIIGVQPAFDTLPWYSDHPTNSFIRHESYLIHILLPAIEQLFPAKISPEGRLLLGFSKSGWGAFTLILRHPEVFGYACSWDAPLMATNWANYGMHQHFGTMDNFHAHHPMELLRSQGKPFKSRTRLVLLGERNFGPQQAPQNQTHTSSAHALMTELGIKHFYSNSFTNEHRWDSGWVPGAIDALMSLLPEKNE